MPDMRSKKLDFATTIVEYAAKADALTRDISALVAYWNDNGFAAGAANEIMQADLDGTAVAHLTPAILASCMTAIANVNLTQPQRTIMRQVAKVAIPPTTR